MGELDMHRRLLACLLAVVFVAMGQQSITVQKLIEFVRSQQQLIKEKKGTDKELAASLGSLKLSERLDAPVIEDLQAGGLGALSLKALQKMLEQSRGLKAAAIQKALPDEPLRIPSAAEQGKIVDEVREYVMNYDNTLPDFICLEVEQRMISPSHGGRQRVVVIHH